MLGKISSWTTKFLSYAGRVQLIKNVLFSIQVFWSQLFVLPTKIIKLIESTCRRFLWTGGVDLSKKALLAWDRVCMPQAAGGLNILDVKTWNRAAISKLLWNICKKKDKLWVRWIHMYYIKGQMVWDTAPKQASWMVQKMLKVKQHIAEIGIQENDLTQMETFSVKKIYLLMRGDFPKVPWRRLVCNNYGAPKWIFILRLVAHDRLYTRDRLDSWGITTTQECSLCSDGLETSSHLFFHCPYSTTIWEALLHWQGIYRKAMTWPDEMQWAATHTKGKNSTSEVYRMVLAASVYHIWIERNHRIFQNRRREPAKLIRQVIQEVFHRGQLRGRLAQRLEMLNFYPQLPNLPVQQV